MYTLHIADLDFPRSGEETFRMKEGKRMCEMVTDCGYPTL